MAASSIFFRKSSPSVFALARRLCLRRHLSVGSLGNFFDSPPPSSSSMSRPVFLARFCHSYFSPHYCFFRYASGVSGAEPPVAELKEAKEVVVVAGEASSDELLKIDDKDDVVGEEEVYNGVIKNMEQLASYIERRARNCAIVKFLENMRIEVAVSDALPPGKSEVCLHSVAEFEDLEDLMNILLNPDHPDHIDKCEEAFAEVYEKEKIHHALMKLFTIESVIDCCKRDVLKNLNNTQSIINSITDNNGEDSITDNNGGEE
ncbi:hypothetical protein LguiA_027833 [Lonicera macranthoides]